MLNEFYNEKINETVVMAQSDNMILEFLGDKPENRFQVRHIATNFSRRYGEFEFAFRVYEECASGLVSSMAAVHWQHLFSVFIKEEEQI